VSARVSKPPLYRLQAYLVASKECLKLLRETLVEFKDVLSIVTVILFFVIGVYEAIRHLLG
jgi:hypothetical protein